MGGDGEALFSESRNRGKWTGGAVTPTGLGLSGPLAGRGGDFSQASSALPRSEARFELLSRTRLIALFGGRWALPTWTEPT
jgi:hypothetical protein